MNEERRTPIRMTVIETRPWAFRPWNGALADR